MEGRARAARKPPAGSRIRTLAAPRARRERRSPGRRDLGAPIACSSPSGRDVADRFPDEGARRSCHCSSHAGCRSRIRVNVPGDRQLVLVREGHSGRDATAPEAQASSPRGPAVPPRDEDSRSAGCFARADSRPAGARSLDPESADENRSVLRELEDSFPLAGSRGIEPRFVSSYRRFCVPSERAACSFTPLVAAARHSRRDRHVGRGPRSSPSASGSVSCIESSGLRTAPGAPAATRLTPGSSAPERLTAPDAPATRPRNGKPRSRRLKRSFERAKDGRAQRCYSLCLFGAPGKKNPAAPDGDGRARSARGAQELRPLQLSVTHVHPVE